MVSEKKIICFDLDGTLADLYGVPGWLDYLHAEDITPYEQAKPLANVDVLNKLFNDLNNKGYYIMVVSWGAKGGSNSYTRRVKTAKMAWCKHYFGDSIQEYHVVKYGTPKHRVCKYDAAILIDDDETVRSKWSKGRTIDASNTLHMIEELTKLVIDARAA